MKAMEKYKEIEEKLRQNEGRANEKHGQQQSPENNQYLEVNFTGGGGNNGDAFRNNSQVSSKSHMVEQNYYYP